eukprot:3292227-Prymnesium_polylepis.1
MERNGSLLPLHTLQPPQSAVTLRAQWMAYIQTLVRTLKTSYIPKSICGCTRHDSRSNQLTVAAASTRGRRRPAGRRIPRRQLFPRPRTRPSGQSCSRATSPAAAELHQAAPRHIRSGAAARKKS